jgi:phosphate-selective porin OprO/OprP
MNIRTYLLAATAMAALPQAAHAQDANGDVAAMRAEIEALKQQISALSAKVDDNAKAAAKKPGAEVKWKGGPELEGEGGWTFKPRGRVQIDVGSVNAPNNIILPASSLPGSLGTATEFRRVYLGAEGSLPGGFGYRVEADIANSSVSLTDVWVTYKTGKATITAGQHKTFSGLEEVTSDLFTSFQERAAFNSAFNFERRVGLSVAYADKDFLVQAGVFSANAADLNSDANNSYSVDGRVVFSPKIGKGQLHLGASAHMRDFNDGLASTRYRARPFVHTTDVRLVDTKAIAATGEHSFGLEAAYITGPFHATIEGHRLTAKRAGLSNPTFQGGYAEAGMFLTKGDTMGYKGGAYDRIKPANPINKGGLGALLLNGRYDYLDLNDEGIVGGKQSTYGVSLIWVPMDYLRFIANYGHLELRDAAIPAGIDRNYGVDGFGVRAQVDF